MNNHKNNLIMKKNKFYFIFIFKKNHKHDIKNLVEIFSNMNMGHNVCQNQFNPFQPNQSNWIKTNPFIQPQLLCNPTQQFQNQSQINSTKYQIISKSSNQNMNTTIQNVIHSRKLKQKYSPCERKNKGE